MTTNEQNYQEQLNTLCRLVLWIKHCVDSERPDAIQEAYEFAKNPRNVDTAKLDMPDDTPILKETIEKMTADELKRFQYKLYNDNKDTMLVLCEAVTKARNWFSTGRVNGVVKGGFGGEGNSIHYKNITVCTDVNGWSNMAVYTNTPDKKVFSARDILFVPGAWVNQLRELAELSIKAIDDEKKYLAEEARKKIADMLTLEAE